ncbi:MAG: DUF441 domain-containing protein [Firmicutes bacterium]|jgi:uncharacterized membrane protein (DUF441 family)|nr:DUF441 domain-containing protein [Bacillota bacterium]
MSQSLPLLIIFLIGVLTKNNLLAAGSGIVLVLGLLNLERLLPVVERRGVELGLLCLTMSILVPFASGKVTLKSLAASLWTPVGLIAVLGGMLGSYLNSQGLDMVILQPEVIPGILVGVMLGVWFLGGIPVGPIMAAGITAVLVSLLQWSG